MKFLDDILKSKYNENELQKIASKLDKSYRLNYFWDGWNLLNNELFLKIGIDINEIKEKYEYRDIYNYIIMKYSRNEKVIKYYLTKKYIHTENEVCMYELNVGNSRLDFGRINGDSHAYEIKTELDNTYRIENQLEDYEDVFDYINVVIHEKHLKKIKSQIPRKIGIYLYSLSDNFNEFECVRAPKLNDKKKKTSQLNMLNSNDLKYIIKEIINSNNIPDSKIERRKIVNNFFNKQEFNFAFKCALKAKQDKKWQHIKSNFDMLKPIEIQDAYTNEYIIK